MASTYGFFKFSSSSDGTPSRCQITKLPFVFGSHGSCQIRIYAPEVQKEHLQVIRLGSDKDGHNNGKLFVQPTSNSLVTINGKALEKNAEYALSHNDVISMEGRHFTFEEAHLGIATSFVETVTAEDSKVNNTPLNSERKKSVVVSYGRKTPNFGTLVISGGNQQTMTTARKSPFLLRSALKTAATSTSRQQLNVKFNQFSEQKEIKSLKRKFVPTKLFDGENPKGQELDVLTEENIIPEDDDQENSEPKAKRLMTGCTPLKYSNASRIPVLTPTKVPSLGQTPIGKQVKSPSTPLTHSRIPVLVNTPKAPSTRGESQTSTESTVKVIQNQQSVPAKPAEKDCDYAVLLQKLYRSPSNVALEIQDTTIDFQRNEVLLGITELGKEKEVKVNGDATSDSVMISIAPQELTLSQAEAQRTCAFEDTFYDGKSLTSQIQESPHKADYISNVDFALKKLTQPSTPSADYLTHVDCGLKRLAQPGTPTADYLTHVDSGLKKLTQSSTPVANYEINVSGVGELLRGVSPIVGNSTKQSMVDLHYQESSPVAKKKTEVKKEEKPKLKRGGRRKAVVCDELQEMAGFAENASTAEQPSVALKVLELVDQVEQSASDAAGEASSFQAVKMKKTRGMAKERLEERLMNVDVADEAGDSFLATIEEVNTRPLTRRARRALLLAAIPSPIDTDQKTKRKNARTGGTVKRQGGRRRAKAEAEEADMDNLVDSDLAADADVPSAAAAAKPAAKVPRAQKVILPAFEAPSGVIYETDIDAATQSQKK